MMGSSITIDLDELDALIISMLGEHQRAWQASGGYPNKSVPYHGPSAYNVARQIAPALLSVFVSKRLQALRRNGVVVCEHRAHWRLSLSLREESK